MATYSVKEGRGLSLAGAVGSLVVIAFGILWTIFAYALTGAAASSAQSMNNFGAFPGSSGGAHVASTVHVIFPLFGVVFILAGIGKLIWDIYNTTAQNRMSLLDVTTGGEEPDPISKWTHAGNEPLADQVPPVVAAPVASSVSEGGSATGPTAAGRDAELGRRLTELQGLRDRGLITAAEFQQQRGRILDSI